MDNIESNCPKRYNLLKSYNHWLKYIQLSSKDTTFSKDNFSKSNIFIWKFFNVILTEEPSLSIYWLFIFLKNIQQQHKKIGEQIMKNLTVIDQLLDRLVENDTIESAKIKNPIYCIFKIINGPRKTC